MMVRKVITPFSVPQGDTERAGVTMTGEREGKGAKKHEMPRQGESNWSGGAWMNPWVSGWLGKGQTGD